MGHEDVPLSDAGRQSIDRLADTWTGAAPDWVVSSDLRRARTSAQRLTARWDIPVDVTEQLRELDFGVWTGRAWDEIEANDRDRLNDWMQDWVETAPPEGESFQTLSSRVVGWLDGVESERSEPTILVVAHAGVIRALLCHALDLPLEQAFRLQIDCGTVSTVERGPGRERVVCVNARRFRRPDGR